MSAVEGQCAICGVSFADFLALDPVAAGSWTFHHDPADYAIVVAETCDDECGEAYELVASFLRQNPIFTATVADADLDAVPQYVEHHAGGAYVLGRSLDGGLHAVLHDSWDVDESVVVHVYHPDRPEISEAQGFPSASAALQAFRAVRAGEGLA